MIGTRYCRKSNHAGMFRRHGLAIGALVLSLVLSPAAWAVDVPFKLEISDLNQVTVEGIGKIENGQFTGQGQIMGRSFSIVGIIQGDEFSIQASGHLCVLAYFSSFNTQGSGSASPAVGKLSISFTANCGGGHAEQIVAYFELPPGPSEVASGGSTSALPPLDMIDQTYVAVNPAKVREKPDPLSARVKTMDVGQKITVVGRLKGQDWYLVSENDQPLGYVVIDQLMPESQFASVASSAAMVGQSNSSGDIAELDFGHYSALVIGNNDYRNGLQVLKTAAGDARAVAQALRSDYGFKVTLLTNATRAQILAALTKLRQTLTENDNLLIYYAGHGSYDQAGDQGYWLPVDARAQDPTNWISNADITTMLKAIQARHVMVVADSCYSGSLTRDANADIRDASYLGRIVQKKARTVMTSGGLEPVADAGSGGHSVFAAAFLATLGANAGVMDAETFFERVRKPVVLAASQTPEYSNLRSAGHEGGDFVFVRK